MSVPEPVVALFAALAAHLAGDTDGLAVTLEGVARRGRGQELVCAGVLTAAECLRDVAEDRGMSPVVMVDVLARSHAEMTGGAGCTGEGRVLAAVHAHLQGRPAAAWLPPVTGDTVAVVRVAAAALSWRARDRGGDPVAAVRVALTCAAGRDGP
jgi:hypothetical protein